MEYYRFKGVKLQNLSDSINDQQSSEFIKWHYEECFERILENLSASTLSIMTSLKQLKPKKKERVMDLVAEAGVDTSDWKNYKRGERYAAANSKYCYEWAFHQPNKIVVLNLWFKSLKQKNDQIFAEINQRKAAKNIKQKENNSTRVNRAIRMDNIIQKAVKEKLPARVVICVYKNDEKKTAKDNVRFRELDNEYWDIKNYDFSTGDCLLVRRNSNIAVSQLLKPNKKELISYFQKDDFEEWLIGIGKSRSTAIKYSGALFGPIEKWALDDGILHNHLVKFNSLAQFQVFSSKVRNLKIFKDRDTKGNNMYGRALSSFEEYLEANFNNSLENDISEIISNISLDETERSTQVQARLGQGLFRRNLLTYWKGCSVTAIKQQKLLIASHIKPWRYSNNDERLDYYNGLLLIPNLDKTFDLGHISFDEKGLIKISNNLEEYERLGINETMRIKLEKFHQPYMQYHRENVFHQ